MSDRRHQEWWTTVEVVIGVDTDKHTHTAAVVAAHSGAVLAEMTAADPDGYAKLVDLTERHGGIRLDAWWTGTPSGRTRTSHLTTLGLTLVA